MRFRDEFQEHASLDERIREAGAERSVHLGYAIADGLVSTGRWLQRALAAAQAVAAWSRRSGGVPILKRFAPHR